MCHEEPERTRMVETREYPVLSARDMMVDWAGDDIGDIIFDYWMDLMRYWYKARLINHGFYYWCVIYRNPPVEQAKNLRIIPRPML